MFKFILHALKTLTIISEVFVEMLLVMIFHVASHQVIADCTGEHDISDKQGTIRSNDQGYTYAPQSHCVWKFSPPDDSYTMINFKASQFNTEQSFDVVSYYTGQYEYQSYLLGQLSGNLGTAEFNITTPEGLVVFTSDDIYEYSGFVIDYKFLKADSSGNGGDGSSGSHWYKEPPFIVIAPLIGAFVLFVGIAVIVCKANPRPVGRKQNQMVEMNNSMQNPSPQNQPQTGPGSGNTSIAADTQVPSQTPYPMHDSPHLESQPVPMSHYTPVPAPNQAVLQNYVWTPPTY